jgi:DNA-binding transcriptional ArsR family regulator
MKRITLSEVEDVKTRIIAVFLNLKRPLRIADISKSTFISRPLIEYHLKSLMEDGIVKISEEKLYILSDVFYDDTLLDGLEDALAPLAVAIADASEADSIAKVIKTLKYLVNVFCETYKEK